ncbi:MAG: hypothetical protein ACW99A_19675, partial [Candidatus Kariarchaeaceae archaeon]
SDPIEYFTPLDIEFTAINETGGGSLLNSSFILFNLTSNGEDLVFSDTYQPATGKYDLTIQWSSQFLLGLGNTILLNWTLPGYRSSISLNYVPSSFDFEVEDTLAPTRVSEPALDTTINETSVGNVLVWNYTDPHPGNYNISVNAVPDVIQNSWDNATTITYNIDHLIAGPVVFVYSIELRVVDSRGNLAQHTVTVTVIDETDPNVDVPQADDLIVEGTTDNFVNWTVSDNHPDNFTIYQTGSNGTEIAVKQGSWSDGENLFYNIDGLGLGTYNFTILIQDLSGNTASSTAIITVVDETIPTISDESDFPYEEFSGGNTITWAVDDTNPTNYTLYLNNAPIQTGNWTANSDIIIPVDGLPLGDHNYTLVIFDEKGNSARDVVIVTVVDTTLPIVSSSSTFSYDEGTTGNTISWNASDAHILSYSITIGSTPLVTDQPISNGTFILNLDGYLIGVHTVLIEVEDTSGNIGFHIVVLTVKDPQITETQLVVFSIIDEVYEGDVETQVIDGWVTDGNDPISAGSLNATLLAINVQGYFDGEIVREFVFSTDTISFNLILNYTGLLNGTYQWVFTFHKDSYESQTTALDTYPVTIQQHTLKIVITSQGTLTQNEEFVITAEVLYDNPRSNNFLKLNQNELTSRTGGVADIEVFLILRYLATTGSPASLERNITTDETGSAIWTLTADETSLIDDFISISATTVNTPGFFIPITEELTEFDLKVQKGSAFDELIDNITEFVETNLLIISAILIAIFIVIMYFWRVVRKRKAKFTIFAKESEDATIEIDGLRSMHGIIMTAGTTGIPFYEYTFTTARTSIDSALISGISTALSMFLNELDEEKLGFEHMERAGVSITSHKSDLSTMMVISDAPLPPVILEQLEEGHKAIESKFSKQLMIPDRMMDIEPINITNELVSKSLKLNLKEDVIIRTNNLKKLSKRKSISRKIRNDMSALGKLAKLSEDTQEPLNLEMILAFLESEKIDHATACRIIYLSYVNFIIVPI